MSTTAPDHAVITVDLRPSLKAHMQIATIDGQTHFYHIKPESMSPNIKFDKWTLVADYKYTINTTKTNQS